MNISSLKYGAIFFPDANLLHVTHPHLLGFCFGAFEPCGRVLLLYRSLAIAELHFLFREGRVSAVLLFSLLLLVLVPPARLLELVQQVSAQRRLEQLASVLIRLYDLDLDFRGVGLLLGDGLGSHVLNRGLEGRWWGREVQGRRRVDRLQMM